MGSQIKQTPTVYLPDIVGKGYGTFWNFKGRYRVVKGGRASKKSKTAALWLIWAIMRYPQANALVVRKVYRTLKDSCFADLKWAAARLHVEEWFDFKLNPLEIIYKPTGQKILFRGLDDPLKITSISVESGYLCFVQIEEAYEITDEDDFNMIDEGIRGAIPPETGLFKQLTLTLNPWTEKHWIKRRFFDVKDDPNILAMTTNYLCNEWLDDADRKIFEDMKVRNPRRYKVAGLGEWGQTEGLVYENWDERAFDIDEVRTLPSVSSFFGLDFGYTADPTALCCGLIDPKAKTIWIYDEMYERGMSNEKIAERLKAEGYAKEKIVADSAEPKSIDRLRTLGIVRVTPAKKGRDSIRNGIDFLSDFHIIVHPRCVNFLTEISTYAWDKDAAGHQTNTPAGGYDHLMDAMRYGTEDFWQPRAQVKVKPKGF